VEVAVVLAAGKGTRLGKVGIVLPKALVPIANNPAIDHIFTHTSDGGYETGHFGGWLEEGAAHFLPR